MCTSATTTTKGSSTTTAGLCFPGMFQFISLLNSFSHLSRGPFSIIQQLFWTAPVVGVHTLLLTNVLIDSVLAAALDDLRVCVEVLYRWMPAFIDVPGQFEPHGKSRNINSFQPEALKAWSPMTKVRIEMSSIWRSGAFPSVWPFN